tara:strand:- start:2677 stop:3084 length:408 start_codon:yes stop_codon:yes gene_type:complete
MPYKQSNNPLSRKTSPLRDKQDQPHTHPGEISLTDDELTNDTSASSAGPSPDLNSGDKSIEPGDRDYEATNKTAVEAGVVSGEGPTGTKRDERKARRQERRNIRKDKDLSRSQKTMAKKESRKKQKDNIKEVKNK